MTNIPLEKQIKKIEVNPKLNKYSDIVREFSKYLNDTSQLSFDIYGETINGESVVKNIPYIHRWTVIYRKSILAKLYQLEDWLRDNPKPITFLSLTTYQDGDFSRSVKGRSLDIYDSLELLMDSYRKLRLMINNRIKGYPVDFFYILEPHKSGYAHMHMLIFDEFTQAEQEKIKRLWNEKYEAGSKKHGVDFEFKKPEERIRSIRNYIMKYISKGLNSSSKYYTESWTPAEAVFNAVLWNTKTRLWNCSRSLQKILKRADEDAGLPVLWYKTVLRGASVDGFTVWTSATYDEYGTKTHSGNAGKDILIKFKQWLYKLERLGDMIECDISLD